MLDELFWLFKVQHLFKIHYIKVFIYSPNNVTLKFFNVRSYAYNFSA